MRHPDEGRLRAFWDGALDATEHDKMQQHLASCGRCSERAAVIRERSHLVYGLLAKLEPESRAATVAPQVARQQLEAYHQERKERRMTHDPFSRRYRPAWAAAVLIMLVAVTLTIPPIRSLAGNLLGLFRVQRIEFTPVSEEDWPEEEALHKVAPEIERMFDQTLTVTTEGEQQRVTEALARERAAFLVRVPDAREESARYAWTPPMHIAFQIDLPQIRAVFAELGYRDIDLPAALDGETVEADFVGILTTSYGACDEDGLGGQDCVTFVQMPSPSVTVPEGLDIDQLGRIYLELLGMPVEEAEELSKQIDWTTTLVLPFPHHVNLTYDTVRVDGVEGTLIHSESGYRPTPEYLLTWIKGEVIYAISGKGHYSEALELAASLR